MKFLLLGFLLCGLGIMFVFLSEIKFFLINLPAKFSNTSITRNIGFDSEHKLGLDIYKSNAKIPQKNKIIVFFYGGNWEFGHKEQYQFMGETLAREGYVVVIPDYRKYPEVKFPEFMFDAANAVEWVDVNADKLTPQYSDIILMGHSAGANMALLLMADKKYKIKHNVNIVAGVGLSGPYNFTPNSDVLKKIFAPSQYHDMRPVNFIDGSEPPIFIGYGLKDNLVARLNFDGMVEALSKHKNSYHDVLYPEKNHAYMLADFTWVGGNSAKVRGDVLNFLAQLPPSKEKTSNKSNR